MLITRGRTIFKNVHALVKQKRSPIVEVPARNSGHRVGYRYVPESGKSEKIASELLAGVAWWWIFWHLWHDWGHVVGEFDLPDPLTWTDEELGIPPDDVD